MSRRWTGWFDSRATPGQRIALPHEDARIERINAWCRRLP